MKHQLLLSLVFISLFSFSQKKDISSFSEDELNWMHYDYKINKKVGVSSQKLYEEILSSKTSKKKIRVAIIDSGVDVDHEDLVGQIWVNTNEIPDNSIDDDNNGYVDDIHGWNFIGNSEGEHINKTTSEITRYYKILKAQIENGDKSEELLKEFKRVEKDYLYKAGKSDKEFQQLKSFLTNYLFSDSVARGYLKVDSLTLENLSGNTNPKAQSSVDYQLNLLKKGFTLASFMSYYEHIQSQVEIRYSLDFNPREAIIGDDLSNIKDNKYGNNKVTGPAAGHGTMVAGLVAAVRDNNLGIDGIANNVEIMVLRTVPDGDEYDKDVALSIRYAVDNGAQIINMSFGKAYSPEKSMAWEAMKYAASKNVLMIKAAGNDNLDIDVDIHYPTAITNDKKIENVLTIGASDIKRNKKLKANFSNYGKESVDIFAPGVQLASLYPSSLYQTASGTSFSSPVVAGVAALIWSYFPELSATELKTILIESATNYSKRKVIIPGHGDLKDQKVRFGTLSQTGRIINAYEAYKLAEIRTAKN